MHAHGEALSLPDANFTTPSRNNEAASTGGGGCGLGALLLPILIAVAAVRGRKNR